MKNNGKFQEAKDSFAVVLMAIMQSDGAISAQESDKFNAFFVNELGLSADECDAIRENSINATEEDLQRHLTVLKELFDEEPMQLMHFMRYLNESILCDGIGEKEYEVFERVKEELL